MSDNGTAYSSRLLKGGALLNDMRMLVRAWQDVDPDGQRDGIVAGNLLGKGTRTRAGETYRRAFVPRFLAGNPPNAWRIARELEDRDLPVESLRPIYYWITARGERLLYDFVCDELTKRNRGADRVVRTTEVSAWIAARLSECGREWAPTVTTKVAQGILASLRDFGILEGSAKKRLAPAYLPLEAFAYLAFTLHHEGPSGHGLLTHPDWALFLLSEPTVEQQFLEADRRGLLQFQAAGRIIRIDFPAQTFEEMADVVAARAH